LEPRRSLNGKSCPQAALLFSDARRERFTRARLAKLIEHGREEIARLRREWEEAVNLIEEQEAEVRE
jgi:hypothetical protein